MISDEMVEAAVDALVNCETALLVWDQRERCLIRARAALEAAERAAWKPISEAPKDGTRILAYDGNGCGPMHIRWHEDWGEWVLADCLLRLNVQELSDAPAIFRPLPPPPGEGT